MQFNEDGLLTWILLVIFWIHVLICCCCDARLQLLVRVRQIWMWLCCYERHHTRLFIYCCEWYCSHLLEGRVSVCVATSPRKWQKWVAQVKVVGKSVHKGSNACANVIYELFGGFLELTASSVFSKKNQIL